jgi:hypothetical protein
MYSRHSSLAQLFGDEPWLVKIFNIFYVVKLWLVKIYNMFYVALISENIQHILCG